MLVRYTISFMLITFIVELIVFFIFYHLNILYSIPKFSCIYSFFRYISKGLFGRIFLSLLSRIVQGNLFQDLVEESSLGVVTEIELLAESLHNHSWVVVLVHFDLLNVLPVELNFQDADWLILSEVWL